MKLSKIKKFRNYIILILIIIFSPFIILESGSYLVNKAYDVLAGVNKHNNKVEIAEKNLIGEKADKIIRDFDKWKLVQPYAYDAFASYTNREFSSETLNIDAKGRRENGRPYDSSYYDNSIEIWAFGSSALFGYPVNADDQTITAQLEAILNNNSEKKYKVINFAVPHYKIFNDIVLFNRLLAENKRPHAVILFNGYNDTVSMFNDTLYESPITEKAFNIFFEMHIEKRVIYWELFYSNILSFFNNTHLLTQRLAKALRVVAYKIDKKKFIDNIKNDRDIYFEKQKISVEKGKNRYLSHLESFWQILDSRGITVINAFQPGLLFTKKELTPEEEIIKNMYRKDYFALNDKELNTLSIREVLIKNRGYDRKLLLETFYELNSKVLKIAENYSKINAIDLSKIIDNEKKSIFTDHIHLTPYGNKVIAQEIHKTIKNIY